MSSDDPFAEPFDTDKTIIRPNPAGRRSSVPTPMPPPGGAAASGTPPMPPPTSPSATPPAASAASAPFGQSGQSTVPLDGATAGLNPLNAAASSLFSLVGRIRNRAQHSDPAALRQSVVSEIQAFVNEALRIGIPAENLRVARYAICATVDDVVLNTPWGGRSIWTQQSMVGTFHKETYGGDRFYDLLSRLEQTPSQNRDLLEFLYVCLSLGFEGRLRVAQRGSEKHLSVRDNLARLIRTHRGPAEPSLSPRWKGMDIPHRLLSAWTPLWVTGGLILAGLCLAFFTYSILLNGESGRLSDQIAALDFGGRIELDRPAPPPPPAEPSPAQLDTVEAVSAFLEPEIKEGLVSVASAGNTLTIRITGSGMFPSASDQLAPRFEDIMDRVAQALDDEPGRIIVAGHSDNVPINTARFPSNLRLSLARAQSVMKRISASLTDKARISAEGRADKEPIASNDTAEGRAKNRRIEVILVKAG
jgi:type VI secretion system protein ImpK